MKKHIWKFARFGGVTQLVFETADDILNLRQLDQKLWTTLAMPTKGIFFNPETAAILDTDADGFIRPPEVLDAVDFLAESLQDVGIIMKDGDTLSLGDIKSTEIAKTAEWALKSQGKTGSIISLADIVNENEIIKSNELGELSDNDSDDLRLKKVLSLYVKENINSTSEAIFDMFTNDRNQCLQNTEDLKAVSAGLETASMLKAVAAFEAVKNKIDDFFVRCKLLTYANGDNTPLTDYSEIFKNFTTVELDTSSEKLRELPIALPNTEMLLDTQSKINPAWANEIKKLYADAVSPLCGEILVLTENDWKNISQKISDFTTVYSKQAEIKAAKITPQFLETKLNQKDEIVTEINERLTFEKEKQHIQSLKKLLLFRKDFFTLLKNYVSFSNFYTGGETAFQAGVLFFDTRATNLCFELNGDDRHATLDILSGAYLLYCDITRGTAKRKLLALLTNGASDNIVVGRNGLFYDRDGNDWNATITKVIANPVSVREAFFSPYKNLARMIEEQIAKKANAANEKSDALVATAADKTVNMPKEAAASLPNKKLDLGTIALIGTAIGGISTLIGSLLQALFGLGLWVPIGLIGLILIISGPSMILAAMKLRKRSIGPILEANGWAINAHAKINIPLGSSLTKLASLPKNARLAHLDPFAEKKKGRNIFIAVLILLLAAAGVFCYFYLIKKTGIYPFNLK
ncbi:hypothetical protein [Treponema denticola]|uniref:hypothetical protein n=1 Tax=Treponema denticola TaxID=158 RepID=UPI0001FD38AC|nr:hypothetical protein [Treponema denticola]EGC78291.1 hypothetical protein HMPREF9353_01138 [Treponema denticola F0402]EMB41784.1 hypothetical protein HMPREF9722_01138 [Treponema denticola ATCC 33520]